MRREGCRCSEMGQSWQGDLRRRAHSRHKCYQLISEQRGWRWGTPCPPNQNRQGNVVRTVKGMKGLLCCDSELFHSFVRTRKVVHICGGLRGPDAEVAADSGPGDQVLHVLYLSNLLIPAHLNIMWCICDFIFSVWPVMWWLCELAKM